jgi:GT2 family glycosyltransferase
LAVQTIVVDNASSDGTVEAIRARYPHVEVVANQANVGFAVATNQGISLGTGRHVLLLNPDAIPVGRGIARLVEVADAAVNVGVVGPRTLNPDGSIQPVCARLLPRHWDWWINRAFAGRLFARSRICGGLYMTWWDHLDSRTVESVNGACMLIPKGVLDRLGDLDTTHPMYLEDVDYCARTLRAGLTNYYAADAVVIHHQGSSSSQAKSRTVILALGAMRLFFLRYRSRADYRIFPLTLFLAQLIRLTLSLVWAVAASTPRSKRQAKGAIARELKVLMWSLRGAPIDTRLPGVVARAS